MAKKLWARPVPISTNSQSQNTQGLTQSSFFFPTAPVSSRPHLFSHRQTPACIWCAAGRCQFNAPKNFRSADQSCAPSFHSKHQLAFGLPNQLTRFFHATSRPVIPTIIHSPPSTTTGLTHRPPHRAFRREAPFPTHTLPRLQAPLAHPRNHTRWPHLAYDTHPFRAPARTGRRRLHCQLWREPSRRHRHQKALRPQA
jgi:hypothetical protein